MPKCPRALRRTSTAQSRLPTRLVRARRLHSSQARHSEARLVCALTGIWEEDSMSETEAARQVLEAADRLVAAFGEGRVDDYFACFHPEAPSFSLPTIGR